MAHDLLSNKGFEPIKDDIGFDPKAVLHVKLGVVQSTNKLEFGCDQRASKDTPDIREFVRTLGPDLVVNAQSPFDIKLVDKLDVRPLWIVLQLDESVDWCFTPGGQGVSAQKPLGLDVCSAHWVDKKGVSFPGDIPPGEEDCTVIWFGLAKLPKGDQHKLNYHVTIKQGDKRLPIIFDPDIRNDGGNSIP